MVYDEHHMIQRCSLRAEDCCELGHGHLGPLFGPSGVDFWPHLATRLGPLAVLFGEHGADQADYRSSVREDVYDGGAPADLAVEPLLWVRAPYLAPYLARVGRKGDKVLPSTLQGARLPLPSWPTKPPPHGRTGPRPRPCRAGRRWCAQAWPPKAGSSSAPW